MKTIAYLDCPSGISGDMFLGALIDAGVPLGYLHQHLSLLGLNQEFILSAQDTVKQGQRAKQACVTLSMQAPHIHSIPSVLDHEHANHPEGHGHYLMHRPDNSGLASTEPAILAAAPIRNLPTIEQLIIQAALPQRVKDWSLAIFQQLGAAEAAVHGISVDQVHFHEVGATDAIVDIVGTCLGLDYLQIDRLICSPLPTGQGRIKAAHGWLPVPAPAVLKLMELGQIPIYSNGLIGELVTPTGAAIAITLAHSFGPPPALKLKQIGLGAGQKDLPVANILRLWVGTETSSSLGAATGSNMRSIADSQHNLSFPIDEPLAQTRPISQHSPLPQPGPHSPVRSLTQTASSSHETIVVLETQVDDLIPQAIGYLYDQLFAVGALDVFTQPIAMKKSRPGVLITVLCRPEQQTACETVLFTETTTLGIRYRQQERTVLRRELKTLQTVYGPVTLKEAYHSLTGQLMNAHPEYEDCATLARQHGVSWQVVHQAALAAWKQQQAIASRENTAS